MSGIYSEFLQYPVAWGTSHDVVCHGSSCNTCRQSPTRNKRAYSNSFVPTYCLVRALFCMQTALSTWAQVRRRHSCPSLSPSPAADLDGAGHAVGGEGGAGGEEGGAGEPTPGGCQDRPGLLRWVRQQPPHALIHLHTCTLSPSYLSDEVLVPVVSLDVVYGGQC